MNFSVIIPTLNEEKNIRACIQSVRDAGVDVEIFVVDGGSTDETVAIALSEKVTVLHSHQGRGSQLNRGAAIANAEILIFLHADTVVSNDMFDVLRRSFSDRMVEIGTCRLAFDMEHPLLQLYALCARLKSFWTTFGDQCIVCRKSFFELIGGFPALPLFEDVALLRSARNRTRIRSFPTTVVTSARKFIENGIVRQQLRSGVLLTLFALGVPPAPLALRYYRKTITS